MRSSWAFRSGCLGLGSGGLLLLTLGLGDAVGQNVFNEREVTSTPSNIAKELVFTLDFRFKDPRLIKINVPGRGTRIFWYMWYQVINRTSEPQLFVPKFELVTLDYPGNYPDEVSPFVQEAIKRIEDPTGYQDIKNSVTISADKIPVSKPADEALPRAVTGVALWDASPADAKKRDPKVKDLSDSTRFSIFVQGLSNGQVTVDPAGPGLPPVIRNKTLQLNFRRIGDRYSTDSRDISFVAPAEWIYRADSRRPPEPPPAPAPKP